MKRTLALILVIILTLGIFAACGSKKQTVLIYSCSEDEVNADLQKCLTEKFPEYDIQIQYLGTGEVYAKLLAEGINTEADIIFDLDAIYAEKLVNDKHCFADLSNYDFSKYNDSAKTYLDRHCRFAIECKTDVCVAYNKKVLAEHNLPVPETFEELLDEKYKGLVCISNPKASGTGYAFYNTLVANEGLDWTLNYFQKLSVNLNDITSSGSAPLKSVNRGESAVAFVMLWQAVEYANENPDIGITFLGKPTGYGLYTFGMIDGKQGRTAVKQVFDYMFNEWNLHHCEQFYPDKIYIEQENLGIPNYPENVEEVNMPGLFDYEYKANLLDKWTIS